MVYDLRNDMRFRWLGIPMWHQAGYTGKGLKFLVVDADTNTKLARDPSKIINYGGSGKSDWTKDYGFHGLASIDVIQQICPDATIYFSSWKYSLETIMEWAIQNEVDIVTVSLRYSAQTVSEDISQRAIDQGMLLFTSAGNNGDVPTDLRGYPAKQATWVAVGAGMVEEHGGVPIRLDYSSTGKELEVMGMTHLYVKMPPHANWMVYTGTSCASPALASCFGLMEQKMGDLTKPQVRAMFTEHCVDMDVEGLDRRTGWGMFRMPNPKDGEKLKEIVLTIGSTKAIIDTVPVEIDQPPIIDAQSNRTLVPLSFIGRALGSQVDWNAENRTVTIDNRIVLTIDSNIVTIDGKQFTIDQAPIIDSQTWRTLVPLSFIARQLNHNVYWDATKRQIIIT